MTMTVSEIVEQLESCDYECEGGPLENNVAFIELKQKAENLDLLPDLIDTARKVLQEYFAGVIETPPCNVARAFFYGKPASCLGCSLLLEYGDECNVLKLCLFVRQLGPGNKQKGALNYGT